MAASTGLGVAAGLLLLARASQEPSIPIAAAALSALPAARQNELLHDAYGRKGSSVPIAWFADYHLRGRAVGEEAEEGLREAMSGIAGNARAVAACGTLKQQPYCLVSDDGTTWREDTPGWVRSTPPDRIPREGWSLLADDTYVYLFHIGLVRYSPDTHRWHDAVSWEGPPGGGEELAVGESAGGLVVCDRPYDAPREIWRHANRTPAGWVIRPGARTRSNAWPVACGLGDGYAYVLARSAADKYSPQTFLLQAAGGNTWDEVNRDDYNFVRDVVPLRNRLVALLRYSAGPFGELGVVDVRRLEWTPSAFTKPDLERLTAISRFGREIAVAGVLKEGGDTLGRDANDQAAVAFGSPDIGGWSIEEVPRMTWISDLTGIGSRLYAAGVNRGGPVIAARDEDGRWSLVAAAPVAWHETLLRNIDITGRARLHAIASTSSAGAGLFYVAALAWLNRARWRRRQVRVFLSYRRSDTSAVAGRVYDRLAGRWGHESVFKDVDSLEPGSRFPSVVAESIRAADAVVCLIGTNWTGVSSEKPEGRLRDPEDWVRREIETALDVGVPIIPALVSGATFPSALPESLAVVREVHALPLREDPDFQGDLRRLISAVEAAGRERQRARARAA